MTFKLITCDTHANEPDDLYSSRLPARFKDRGPRVVQQPDGRPVVYLGDKPNIQQTDHPLGRPGDAWYLVRRGEGSWDPEKRLAAQDRDGIAAELVQAGNGSWTLMVPDSELQLAMARVWNDWAMEVYKPHIRRIQPTAILPVLDIPAAIDEAKRVARLGYTSVQMPDWVEFAYWRPEYDPLWATLQDNQLAVNMHIRTGTRKNTPFRAGRVHNFVEYCLDGVNTASTLCSTGVFERFPGVHVIFLEIGLGWAPWLMRTMDGIYDAHGPTSITLRRHPSEYFKSNCHAGVMFDSSAMSVFREIGIDCFLFANDYPHPEGTWPESQKRVQWQVDQAEMSEDEVEAFTHKNAEKLYRFQPV